MNSELITTGNSTMTMIGVPQKCIKPKKVYCKGCGWCKWKIFPEIHRVCSNPMNTMNDTAYNQTNLLEDIEIINQFNNCKYHS
jgi:hypothetical protein